MLIIFKCKNNNRVTDLTYWYEKNSLKVNFIEGFALNLLLIGDRDAGGYIYNLRPGWHESKKWNSFK